MYLSYANSMSLASGSWERLKKEASICTSSPFSNVGWILPASNRLKLPLGTSCDTWKVSLNTLVHGAWATFNKWSEKSIVEMSKTTTLKQTKLWNDSTSGEMLKKMHFENFSKYIYIYRSCRLVSRTKKWFCRSERTIKKLRSVAVEATKPQG